MTERNEGTPWKCPECGAETDGWHPVDHKPTCQYCKKKFDKLLAEKKGAVA